MWAYACCWRSLEFLASLKRLQRFSERRDLSTAVLPSDSVGGLGDVLAQLAVVCAVSGGADKRGRPSSDTLQSRWRLDCDFSMYMWKPNSSLADNMNLLTVIRSTDGEVGVSRMDRAVIEGT